jgi:hypothetical protein
MPTPPDQMGALDDLRKSINRSFPELKEKKVFWLRKASILKVGGCVCVHVCMCARTRAGRQGGVPQA